jgi:hypothetical protein
VLFLEIGRGEEPLLSKKLTLSNDHGKPLWRAVHDEIPSFLEVFLFFMIHDNSQWHLQ